MIAEKHHRLGPVPHNESRHYFAPKGEVSSFLPTVLAPALPGEWVYEIMSGQGSTRPSQHSPLASPLVQASVKVRIGNHNLALGPSCIFHVTLTHDPQGTAVHNPGPSIK